MSAIVFTTITSFFVILLCKHNIPFSCTIGIAFLYGDDFLFHSLKIAVFATTLTFTYA